LVEQKLFISIQFVGFVTTGIFSGSASTKYTDDFNATIEKSYTSGNFFLVNSNILQNFYINVKQPKIKRNFFHCPFHCIGPDLVS